MSETWKHPSMPGLVVHPAGLQEKQRLERLLPAITSPLQKAAYYREGADDPALNQPSGAKMLAGEPTGDAFDLNVHPWIGTVPLYCDGHDVPAQLLQVRFFWKKLQAWTTGPLPSGLFDFVSGAIETLWVARMTEVNEAVQNRLNRDLTAPT